MIVTVHTSTMRPCLSWVDLKKLPRKPRWVHGTYWQQRGQKVSQLRTARFAPGPGAQFFSLFFPRFWGSWESPCLAQWPRKHSGIQPGTMQGAGMAPGTSGLFSSFFEDKMIRHVLALMRVMMMCHSSPTISFGSKWTDTLDRWGYIWCKMTIQFVTCKVNQLWRKSASFSRLNVALFPMCWNGWLSSPRRGIRARQRNFHYLLAIVSDGKTIA